MEILIKRLRSEATLPVYADAAGPGIGLYAAEAVTVAPGECVRIATGVAMAMPIGHIGLICSQRSLAINDPLQVTTDVLDSGYRDEVVVEVTNNGSETREFAAGELVAQLLVQQVHRAHLIEAEDLSGAAE